MTANLIWSFCFALALWLALSARYHADAVVQQALPWLSMCVFAITFWALERLTRRRPARR